MAAFTRSSSAEPHEEIIEGFCERGVGEDTVPDRSVGNLTHHGDLQDRHDLAAANAENGTTENLLRLRVDERFHESAGLVHLECAGDR